MLKIVTKRDKHDCEIEVEGKNSNEIEIFAVVYSAIELLKVNYNYDNKKVHDFVDAVIDKLEGTR